MKVPSRIDISKIRDTHEIYKLAFHYMSQNAATLLLPLLSIAFPLIIISEISAIAFAEGSNPFNRLIFLKRSLDPNPFLAVILFFIVYLIGISLYNYFINDCLLKSEKIAKGEVQQRNRSFFDTFKTYFINFIILYIIFYVVSNLSDFYYRQFMTDMNSEPIEGIVGYIFRVVINRIPWIIIMPPFLFFCFAASYLSYRDQIGSSDALVKIWKLVKEKMLKVWYNSIMVSGLFFGLILTLKIFIYYILGITGFFHNNLMTLYNVITIVEIVFILLAMIHLHVSMVLLYGSFEDEAHGVFIKRKVEEL